MVESDGAPAGGETSGAQPLDDDPRRWGMLALLSLAVLLGMSEWFTASAVAPDLQARWGLTATQVGWLTTVVQLGFVAGTEFRTGGDRYLILINRESDEMIFIMKSVWDTVNDKIEFSNAFQAYGEARFGTGASFQDGGQLWEADTGVHTFVETDEATIWIAAPNPNLAQQIYEAIK